MEIKTLADFNKVLKRKLALRGFNSTLTSNPPKTGKEDMQKRLFITPRPGPIAPLPATSSSESQSTQAED